MTDRMIERQTNRTDHNPCIGGGKYYNSDTVLLVARHPFIIAIPLTNCALFDKFP